MKIDMLIIGAGRSGTTTLYEHLKSHPDICFSNAKEVPYFSIQDVYKRGESYYHSFFKHNNQKIIASSDTYLLIDKDAPKRIFDYNPDMKIIILLREPVERSYSSYVYAVNNGHEKKATTFRDAYNNERENIANSDIIKKNNLGHFYTGLYYKHVKYWMQFFPVENFLLIKTNDLKENYRDVLIKISRFLNVREIASEKNIKTNEASGAKFMFLHKFLINRNATFRKILAKVSPNFIKEIVFNSGIIEKINKINKKPTEYKPMSKEDSEFVADYFKEDLQLLKDEFGISF